MAAISASGSALLLWHHLLSDDGTPNPSLYFLADSLFTHFAPSATSTSTSAMSLTSLSTFYTSMRAHPLTNPTLLGDMVDIEHVFRHVGWEHIVNPAGIRHTRDGFVALVRDLVAEDPENGYKDFNLLIFVL